MFRCFFCGEVVSPRVLAKKVVTGWRTKYYPERIADPKTGKVIHRPLAYIDEKGKKKLRYPSDPGGWGKEMIGEVAACPSCAAQHQQP